MEQDKTNRAAEAGDAVFSAADYFLGIALRVAASRDNILVALPGKGEVYLFPERKEFCAIIPDMVEFCQAPAAQFKTTVLGRTASPPASAGSAKNMNELLWQAAFHASQGRMIENCSKYDVVQFRRWPNLSRLPLTENTMRICALLTRHPTTIMLVPRKLGIEKAEVYRIYSAASSSGIVNMVSRNPQAASIETLVDPVEIEPTKKRGLLRSLFAKISGL